MPLLANTAVCYGLISTISDNCRPQAHVCKRWTSVNMWMFAFCSPRPMLTDADIRVTYLPSWLMRHLRTAHRLDYDRHLYRRRDGQRTGLGTAVSLVGIGHNGTASSHHACITDEIYHRLLPCVIGLYIICTEHLVTLFVHSARVFADTEKTAQKKKKDQFFLYLSHRLLKHDWLYPIAAFKRHPNSLQFYFLNKLISLIVTKSFNQCSHTCGSTKSYQTVICWNRFRILTDDRAGWRLRYARGWWIMSRGTCLTDTVATALCYTLRKQNV